MSTSDDFSTFSIADMQKLIIDIFNFEIDLVNKSVAEGVALTRSDEISSSIRLIINDLNSHLMQHVSRMIDYSNKYRNFWGQNNEHK